MAKRNKASSSGGGMKLELPVGKQAASIVGATKRLNVWEGSVRSGKTVASILAWLFFVVTGPPGELLMVGRSERTLKRNILDPILDLVGEREFRLVQGTGECWILGRRVYIAGANDARSEMKIRGLTLAGAYGDEVTTWPESFWGMLLSRLSIPGAKVFVTTNPDSPYHWFKTQFLDREKELDMSRWHFTLDDNPHLDPEYVAQLRREYVGLWYRRYILGLWVMAEGAIYDMWDEARHVVPQMPALAQAYYVGIDYGTANPTAFVMVGVRGERAWVERVYKYDAEEKGRQQTDAEFSADLKRWVGDTRVMAVFCDPSAASFKTQLRRDGWMQVRDADHSVLDGIRTVATMLSGGQFCVVQGGGTEALIEEFGGYVWDAKAQEHGEDKPLKVNDHCMDALRYVLHSIFGRGTVRAVRGLY